MILTCPDCATSYFVDDDRVPPQGRMVKCTSCSHRWRATHDAASSASPGPAPRVATEPRATPVAALIEDDLEFVATKPKPQVKTKSPRKWPVGLIVGAAGAGALAAGIGSVVVLRQQVVDIAPASAGVFTALGLEVDTLGLVIEDVTSKAVMQTGRPVLAITGAIRNRYDAAAEAPPIRISLIDADHRTVASLLAEPLNAKVPAGARRYFSLSLPNPPAGAHELEIAFDLTAKVSPEAAAVTPEIVEAKSLPPGSPDALTAHEHE